MIGGALAILSRAQRRVTPVAPALPAGMMGFVAKPRRPPTPQWRCSAHPGLCDDVERAAPGSEHWGDLTYAPPSTDHPPDP